MKRFYIILLLLIATVSSAVAETTFVVYPPRNVVEGSVFKVVYRLNNGEGNALKAPTINGCELLYGPASFTQQSMQIINGVTTSSYAVDYTYTYRAEKSGTFTIPAASISVDGKTLRTEAVNFTVLPADRKSSRQSSGNPSANMPDFDSQASDKPVSKDDIFVRVILNKSTAYEQEAVECTLKLYTKYEAISSFVPTKPASFDDFLIDEVNQQAQLNDVEHYNGQNYRTAILKKCIIFPQKTGVLEIKTGTYDITIQQLERISNGYFYMTRPIEKSVKLQSYTAKLNVKPLPTAGKPASFNGAVGSFTLKSNLSSQSLRTNEAASLTISVNGNGNIKYLKEPTIQFPSEFEQYTPKLDTDTHVAGNTVKGTTTFEYTFVPQTVGKFEIPATEFSYFDPAQGKYITLSTTPYTINVAKGAAVSTDVEQQDIKIKNTDILHIKLGDKDLKKTHEMLAYQTWYWLLYPLLIVALAALIVARRRNIKRNADVVGRKNARAGKVAKKRLSTAAKFMKANDSNAFYDSILKALWGYISDKLAIPASTLTRGNVADELTNYGASQELTDKLIGLLDECELARYTPQSSNRQLKEIYNDSSEVMNQMEAISKKSSAIKKSALTLLILLSSALSISAQSITDKADQAYNLKDYPKAVSLYNQALKEQGSSSLLYYNLGNAYYRCDSLAKAIICYERSLKLDPTNDDARTNLQFVNTKIIDTPIDTSSYSTMFVDRAMKMMSPNAWATTSVILFVIVLAAIAGYLFSSNINLRKFYFFGGLILLLIWAVSIAITLIGSSQSTSHDTAIVTATSTQLSTAPSTPTDNSEQAFLLHEGSKVAVLDSVATPMDETAKKWYEVRVDNEHRAWINGDDIEII